MIRLLQNVGGREEFKEIWSFLLTSVNGTTEFERIVSNPSRKDLVACVITPDMANKLLFVLKQVSEANF